MDAEKRIKIIELSRFFEELEPGTSSSRYAGFRGNRELYDGADWDGNTSYYIKIDGWHQYSSKNGRYIHRGALLLQDGDDLIFRRVPGTFESFGDAWNWMVPVAVRTAKEKGKKILRQGDVYFVESKKDNLDNLPFSHSMDSNRVVTHAEHETLDLSDGCYRVYRQRQIATGFGGTLRND